jgi:prolyl oligopeptidase
MSVNRWLAVTLLASSAFPQTDHGALQKLFSDYYEDYLRWHPEVGTSIGRREFNRAWTDHSPAARERQAAAMRTYLERLRPFEAAALGDQDRISVRLLHYQLEESLIGDPLSPLFLIGQLFGVHNRVLQTLDQMPAESVRDYEDAIARISAVPEYVDRAIAGAEEGFRRGIVQPKLVAELVIGQLARQGSLSEDASPVLTSFRRFPASIPQADRDRLTREARAAYATRFLPAWQKLHRWAVREYLPKARSETAISAIPDGPDWYTKLVRHSTTTELTPRQIHDLGRRELDRIEREMTEIARAAGHTGTVLAFQKKLMADPAQTFRSKEEMLVYCRNIAKLAEPELPRLFKRLPRAPFGIRPIPEDREAATASHYMAPPVDGSRAGFFMLNTYKPEEQVKYEKAALVLHEGVPGHHLQLAIQREIEGLPDFRKLYSNTAYAEGWALYAESLGNEMGIYDDPAKRFGKLTSERFRAVRLVVDTGLHSLGWSRNQAVSFFAEHAPDETLAEIDRYISWPAQALGYKIGQLKIAELRARAEKELGSKFDLREFHDVVLRNGPLPLELLESEVTAMIRSRRAN